MYGGLLAPFFVILFCLQSPGLHGPMYFDSGARIGANASLFEQSGFVGVIRTFPQRPIPMITFFVNYRLTGMDPFFFRIVNMVLLSLLSVLVAILMRITLELPGPLRGVGQVEKYGMSLFVGIIFLVHPVQIYLTLYIWQRMTILAYLFYLASVISYLSVRMRFVSSWLGYSLLLVFFVAALLSKENAVTLPVILALFELSFFWKSRKDFFCRAVLLGLILAATVGVVSCLQHPHGHAQDSAGILSTIREYYKESGLSLKEVVLTQSRVILKYLAVIAIPTRSEAQLVAPQIISSSLLDPPITLAAVAAAAGVALLGIRLLFIRPLSGIGILFFLINVLPDCLLVPQYAFFGYRPVLGIVGLGFLVSDCIVQALSRVNDPIRRRYVRLGLTVLGAAYCVFLGSQTVEMADLWADKVRLLKGAVAAFPWDAQKWEQKTGSLILHALGSELAQQGRLIEAREYLHLALELHPGHPVVLTSLASICREGGNVAGAEAYLEKAVQNPVAFPRAYSDLGLLKLDLGKADDAIRYLEIAFKLTPHDQRVVRALQTLRRGQERGPEHRRSP